MTETDVDDVVAWAREHADGRRCTVWAEFARAGVPGIIRLSGWNPNQGEPPPAWLRS